MKTLLILTRTRTGKLDHKTAFGKKLRLYNQQAVKSILKILCELYPWQLLQQVANLQQDNQSHQGWNQACHLTQRHKEIQDNDNKYEQTMQVMTQVVLENSYSCIIYVS